MEYVVSRLIRCRNLDKLQTGSEDCLLDPSLATSQTDGVQALPECKQVMNSFPDVARCRSHIAGLHQSSTVIRFTAR